MKRYEKWKDIVQISLIRRRPADQGFHGERLQGEWEGHRSSRLNTQDRVIYKVEEYLVQMVVMDVTASHIAGCGTGL
ncbi:MAG: hypothetical protein OJF50_000921 [Nitrospira sp.]|nr:hypothetical protein [Nitrospira sp.]